MLGCRDSPFKGFTWSFTYSRIQCEGSNWKLHQLHVQGIRLLTLKLLLQGRGQLKHSSEAGAPKGAIFALSARPARSGRLTLMQQSPAALLRQWGWAGTELSCCLAEMQHSPAFWMGQMSANNHSNFHFPGGIGFRFHTHLQFTKALPVNKRRRHSLPIPLSLLWLKYTYQKGAYAFV